MKKVWGIGRIFLVLLVLLVGDIVVIEFLGDKSLLASIGVALVGAIIVCISLLGLHKNIGKIISSVSKGISTAQSKALTELRVPVLITTDLGEIVWYNAKFDFAQIDYKILASQKDLWKPHNEDKASKGQPWTFSSIHNDMGARYCYKLWVPYKRKGKGQNRHTRTHSFDFRDFMNFFQGGLKRLLEDLDVEDNAGNKIRKLTMEYQAVDTDNLTDNEIDYCVNDVKGLYFAVKKFNESIEEQSNGECHIFGKDTNLMTAGGFAKSELLRSLYQKPI